MLVWTKAAGLVDRAIDMRLGGEVEDGGRLMLGQRPRQIAACGDVALHELDAITGLDVSQCAAVARVGQLVQHNDAVVAVR